MEKDIKLFLIIICFFGSGSIYGMQENGWKWYNSGQWNFPRSARSDKFQARVHFGEHLVEQLIKEKMRVVRGTTIDTVAEWLNRMIPEDLKAYFMSKYCSKVVLRLPYYGSFEWLLCNRALANSAHNVSELFALEASQILKTLLGDDRKDFFPKLERRLLQVLRSGQNVRQDNNLDEDALINDIKKWIDSMDDV